MIDEQVATVYDYTSAQAEVVRLHDRLRRCLMDQKYYARRLSLYQRWDIGTSLLAGIAMILSLITLHAPTPIAETSYAMGILAAIAFIGKPIFKVSEQIEKYTILRASFAEAFCGIDNLLADIRRTEKLTEAHRIRAEELIIRCDGLTLRDDVSVNKKELERIKAEVEQAIPHDTLWLPSK